MDNTPWEVARPDRMLASLHGRVSFDRPGTWLVLVDAVGTGQNVLACTLVWANPSVDDTPDEQALAKSALERLGVYDAPWTTVRPIVVPVIVRPGPAWYSWDESAILLALRYNCFVAHTGDPLTVTERGWFSPCEELYGTEPKARWSAQTVVELTTTRTLPEST